MALQMLGLLFLVVPLVAVQWNLAGRRKRRSALPFGLRVRSRWRLEIYSNFDNVADALADRADMPFPVKQVRSARGQLAQRVGGEAWSLPRIELELDVEDPFSFEVLTGLLGPDHRVRFVSGNEAVVDARGPSRLRLRVLPLE
jgi:hypothetical protein